jgi:hypothetical protein
MPLPCGLILAPFDKLRAGLARHLINEKIEIVFGMRSSHISHIRSILHFEIAGNEQQDHQVQPFFRKSSGM